MPLINLRENYKTVGEIFIKDVQSLKPFPERLEYSCPARGTWTIAHTSMLLPESHQIFIGASACLRGVVLSAGEYEGLDRFSMLLIDEEDIIFGNMEKIIIDGISDIINNLPYKPRAVLGFCSCIHHFILTDFSYVYENLNRIFPDIDFLNCSMHPTMRKNTPNVEEHLISSLYSPLEKRTFAKKKQVNLIGGNLPIDPLSDHIKLLSENGIEIKDLARCNRYEEYIDMGESSLNIYSLPNANYACKNLNEKLNQDYIYLPYSWEYDDIESGLNRISEYFELPKVDVINLRKNADAALKKARSVIGESPISIDFSATPMYLGLAKLLVEHKFNVVALYGDVIINDEKETLDWLRENAPGLKLIPTKDFHARFNKSSESPIFKKKHLAIGQKAAYFSGTDYFVNMIENNASYGFYSIEKLSNLMIDAFFNKKDRRKIIQVKGLGCSA